MSNYTKSTNFATKDNLTPGDPLKIVRGTEIDTEFNNIATAIATKTDNSAAAITGGSITGITDLAIADGGTGASTANAALNNLLPSQASASGKYLKSNGTDASWDQLDISTADITGTLPVANGGTGVTSSTGTGSVVLSNSPTLVTPALGTPSSGTLTNATGLPISTGVSGLGTGVATFLGTPSSANLASAVTDETGSGALVFANSPTLVTPTLGTPASATLTNATGLPISTGVSGLGTGVATFLATPSSANLASAVSDETGSGALVFANSPTLVTPALGTPSSGTLTNATGLPISTGVSGLGTGVATALAVNVGSAGAPVVNGGALGTPSSGTVTNLTGTASININGTVGATTPTTGAFTTLSASSSVTLSGGTANGVTYLNGSKVLTSGSALTFDGTNFTLATGTIYVGTTSTTGLAGAFSANSYSTDTDQFRYVMNWAGSGLWGIGVTSSTSGGMIFGKASGSTGGVSSELMRLTSTGLGIGTSSPAAKLQVVGESRFTNSSSAGVAAYYDSLATAGEVAAYNWGGSAWLPLSLNGGSLLFKIESTEKMRLDSSGNLGLGVTPSAWNTAFKVFEFGVKGNAVYSHTSNYNVNLSSNAYYNAAGFKYGNSAAASYYNQYNGIHSWYNAPSGTAGNAISFSQVMTLDASGNLGVGTTTPYAKIHATGTIKVATGNAQGILALGEGNGTSVNCGIWRGAANAPTTDGNYLNFGGYDGIVFATGAAVIGSQTERARIDSSGNLLVAKTTSNSLATAGVQMFGGSDAGAVYLTRNNSDILSINRLTSDGLLVVFYQDTTQEGNISVSGTTVSYNGGHLSRYAQTTTTKDDSILKGTILSNLDEMNVYTKDGQPVANEQLNKVKVSDTEGDVNVAGVFVNWSHDEDHNVDEINMAMTGDMIIRIAQGVTVVRGDLLMSAGDGTAKPQGDDIIRSKTVAKVTSNHVTCTYADGSYCVPCVLMAC